MRLTEGMADVPIYRQKDIIFQDASIKMDTIGR
jgi:hypothetical protein